MKNKSAFIKIPLLIVGIAAVAVLVFLFIQADNQYIIEEAATQYYGGQKYTVASGTKLSMTSEGTVNITDAAGTREASSIAIYQEEDNRIIIPKDMVYYDPRNDTFAKIDAFTEIVVSDTEIIATNGNKECSLNKGFIYDGEDYYLFLEDVSVSANKYTFELSCMSYIEAVYQVNMITLDYDTKDSIVEVPTTDIIVTGESGDYTLNLLNDLLENHEGEKSLLFSRPDLLDSIF